MALLGKSPPARALGAADLAALVAVATTMTACHIVLMNAPWAS